MNKIRYIVTSITILILGACQKLDFKADMSKDDFINVRIAPYVPLVKSLNYFAPDTNDVFAYGFVNQEESVVSGIKQDSIDEDGIHLYSLSAGSDSVVFSNCSLEENWNDQFDHLSCSKDFDTKTLTFKRSADLYSTCDLVAGGASVNDTDSDGVVKVHLHRLTAYLSATLRFVDAERNELTFTDYIQKAGLAVVNQAVSVGCDVKGNVSISERSLDNGSISYVTSQSLCSQKPMFPTSQGMNAEVKLYLKNYDGSVTVLTKELSYPFERNKHYVLTITVKRNETAFGGFMVEDIVSETIDIQLNYSL